MQTLDLKKTGDWNSTKRTETITMRASKLEVGLLDFIVKAKKPKWNELSRVDLILKAVAVAFPIEFEQYCAANDLESK